MESVDQKLEHPLQLQPGLKEKFSLLDHFQSIVSEAGDHAGALQRLTAKARELYQKTEDDSFKEAAQEELKTQFNDLLTVSKEKMRKVEEIVKDHLMYLDAVQEFTDWLHSAKEELHRWSDTSGDSSAIQKKLSKIKELMDSRETGASRLGRVESLAPAVRQNTTASGCELLDTEMQALRADWKQWEDSVSQTQTSLENLVSQMALSEQEFSGQVAQLEQALEQFSALLTGWAQQLTLLEGKNTDKEIVECWHKGREILDALQKAEPQTEDLKSQLNELCRFSRDLSTYSGKVSGLIKEYNCLCLQASKGCQNKEQILQQRFRRAFKDFQQWLVNAKITTAKCFDIPQNISEVSTSLQKIQEFLSESEHGQHKLNMMVSKGELLNTLLTKEKANGIQAKIAAAKEDWKNFHSNLHQKESALENLKIQMKDFEVSAEPVQEWLSKTEKTVHEGSDRLHDLPAKRREQQKLQLGSNSALRAHLLLAVFVSVSFGPKLCPWCALPQPLNDLSLQGACCNGFTGFTVGLLLEKVSRLDRIVAEHSQFSAGVRELQDWMTDAVHMLDSYCHPTSDKSVLDSRMLKLEALLSVKQEKEIQMKMIVTRGESVLQNTSPEGVPAIQQQLQSVKDMWASLLSAGIRCKRPCLPGPRLGFDKPWPFSPPQACPVLTVGFLLREWAQQDNAGDWTDWAENASQCASLSFQSPFSQLEGALSKWTSYQDDVRQFSSWMDSVEASLNESERQYAELREKMAALGKAKLLNEEVLSHSSLLETIEVKGAGMTEHYVTQLEFQDLQERYGAIRERAKEAVTKSEKLVRLHQEYQRDLKAFEAWLAQEQEKLDRYSVLEGDAHTHETTLRDLQELQVHCAEGQALLNSVLHTREEVIPSGIPQTEDRALESLRQDWQAYQQRLSETRTQFNNVVNKLRLMEQKFQQVDEWLKTLEEKVNLRTGRQSNRAAKEIQLHQMKKWHEEVTTYRDEVEDVGSRAQEILDESHVSSRTGCQATQLTSRYQALLLQVLEQIQFLEEEIQSLEESELSLSSYSDWYCSTHKNFKNVAAKIDKVDKAMMGKKMKTLEGLLKDMEKGQSLLKSAREKGERAVKYLEDGEAETLRKEIHDHVEQLKELTSTVRKEHLTLEKGLHLAKEFSDKYKALTQWIGEYQEILHIPEEPKMELYEKKAQLSKYKEHVCSLEAKVRDHEDYNSELQEVEKWLLQMSGRLVAPDLMETSSLETITQQLAHHKAMMEEIAGFEDRLNNLKIKGDNLISQCADHLQAKLKQNVQAHVQGTKDSYSAVCSTAQRVYQSLEHELQKHVSRQDTLQQCQAWLSAVQPDLKPSTYPPLSRAEAVKQVKHFRALQEQARTYLDLLCSMCDLSNSSVKTTAKDIQQTEQMDFLKKLQSKQASVTTITEKVDKLTKKQESPEHKEISHLNDQWLDLCLQSTNLCLQREEDLQRTRDYHDCLDVVEVFLEKFTTEWDNLARSDAESTAVHLEALRKLALALQERKQAIDDLKERKQKMVEHLNLDDKELVKEQTSHLEQRWFQLEDLVKRKIQASITNLEELSVVRSRFQELMQWAEEQQPTIAEALKQSPPPDMAQSLLMDHLAICSELEAKQMLLKSLIKDADRVMTDLGLNERQMIQKALSDAQRHVNSLSDLVGQRRKYLNKALSEKTQFLIAVFQATSQIQQHERKIMFREHICLLPDDVSKQVKTCRSAQASLKTYQNEVTGLWAQGRELMKGATEQEKNEVLGKLQELQSVYDTVLQKCSHRLQELEKNLVSRKHFKEDFDKACHWLKQADIITFPEINLMNESPELHTQLAKYQHILEQSPEYENLLFTLQRTGQAMLPSLNEVDHSYLNEKLSALPLQFNVIVDLAKDKFYKVQEAILAQKEYASLIELTTQTLSELEDQFSKMSQVPTDLVVGEALSLQDGCRALAGEVAGLAEAVDELNQKKESFRSTGQPWQPDKMLHLVTLYHRLKRQTEQRVSLLEDTTSAYQEHEKMCQQLEKQLEGVKTEQSKVNEETLPAEEKLKLYHSLAGSLRESGILLKRVAVHLEDLVPHLDPLAYEKAKHQMQSWQEELKQLTSAIGAMVTECESRMVQSRDFQTELSRSLDWLRGVKAELSGPLCLDLNLRDIQEEIRKVQIHQEEVQSSLRIMNALSDREQEKFTKAKELISADLQHTLAELAELDGDVQEALRTRQATLTQIYSQCQRYYQVFQAANDWLEDAHEMLQLTGNGLDVESAEESLKSHMEFFSTEDQFHSSLEELQGLVANLDPLIKPTGKEDLAQKMTSLEEKSQRILQDSHAQSDLLQRCAAQWQDYQKAREEVIELMNDAEKKLSEFSLLKTSSSLEAEEKLSEHKALVSVVNSFHEKIVALEGRASELERSGNDSSKATIGRSRTAVRQRWTRLRAVAQDQEKILEDAVDEWKGFNEKVKKATEMIDQLQEKLPGTSAEKASKAELLTLLEHHDALALELEQQQSAMGMLRRQALSMLRDGATPTPGAEPAAVQGVAVLQERCLNMQEKVKKNGQVAKQELKERQVVETHINSVKAWVQETKEYLGNPTLEVDAQLEELKILLTEATNHRQNIEKMAEEQKNKYLDLYTILPSELSLQLAEVALDLGTIHDQIQDKVKEVEQSKAMSQEFSRQIQKIAKDLTTILTKLRAKTDNLVQAKTDQKALGEELECCNLKLMELNEAVQKFSEQNGQLGKPLAKKIGKLTELHQQTIRQAENRLSKLSQAASHLEEYNEILELILKWIEKAKVLVHGKIAWNSASQLREQYISHQDMKKFETELRNLQVALEQAQTTLTSPEVGRLSLKEQLSHRQEAVVQYEQYEQEMQHLQELIEGAHREIEDKPVATSNIQELQAQISRHEGVGAMFPQELAQKIKGYQEQIASLNSKCKMLTMKAKHATMLLTDIAYYQALSAERLQTDAAKIPPGTLPSQELYEPGLEPSATAKLDDLQRSWETLKNVISEKQRTLYEALERQQKYQDSLQSISTKMEAIEMKLSESLEHGRSPESQMAEHQALMDEILMLQEEISELQSALAEELVSESPESDPAEQLALQSTLTVLAERMSTIKMKASGKRQLLEEKLNDQLEEQRQEQALQRYLCEAEELDHWLLSTKATLDIALGTPEEPMDMEAQLVDCQNMLVEIEQKVVALSELSVHNENLLLEGKAHTKDEAEQLAVKLRTLKGNLLELQRALHDKQLNIQLYSRPNRLLSGVPLYKGDGQAQDKSAVTSLLDGLNQAFEEVSSQGGGTKRQNIHLEQKLYDGVSATSTWLDDVEERLFVATALLPEETETCLFNQETLAKDIKEMSEEMDKNKILFSQAFPENGDNRGVIEDTLGCLLGRLSLLDSVVNQRCHQMKERLQQILNFQNDLKVLFTSLADHKYIILQKLATVLEQPVAEQIEAIQQAEDGLKELDAGIIELKRRADKLQVEQPSMQELSRLQDMYDELMVTIGSRRSGLNQNLALKSQYERALQDLADLLDTGREKMAGDQKIIVSSKEEIQQLLDKHKEYFQGLESHMILTETLFRKIISFAVQRETQFHTELMAQAAAVLKRAHKRGVELEYILETWSHLDEDHRELSRQLEVVEGSIPSVGLVEESEDRLIDRITLYQHLKSSLNEYQPKLYQVLDDGKRLLISISCSDLESQLNQLGEHWLNDTNKVSKELHRLETILKHWTRYQSESADLIHWLQSAKDRLEFWTQQSVTVPQELEMVRDHLNAFLEFSKEVDAKSTLKSSVLSTGNQLLRLKKVDTAALRSELSHIDGQWTDLLTNIPAVQEKLHQLQMDKLPSRHAISEVMAWISLMENVIQKDEENIKNSIGYKAIHEYLQKYKGFKIDINCKQLTVDFVNQSVLQISSQDVESKRSDKTDFAEQLGAMNKSWQILQGLVTEKIQLLEGLLESWSEYENNVQCLKTWFETQEKRLKQQHRIGDQASVQNAMKDCQDLEDLIKAKEKEVEKIEQNGLALIQNKNEEVSGIVMSTLRELNQTWADLDHMVEQLKILLKSVLDQWSHHKAAFDEINSRLTEARYSLSRFRLLTGSLEAVQVQVDNLQNLQDDLEKQEKSLQKFGSITNQLLKECHPPVTETLTNTLKEVNLRWNNLLEEIAEQLHSSKALLQLWQRYKDYSKQCASTVQQQEGRTNELLKAATDKDIADDEVATWIQDCNDLLKGLETVKDSLFVLHELGEQLKQQVDASAASAIQSDQVSLNQHLGALEQALCKQQTMLQISKYQFSFVKKKKKAGVLDYETFTKSLEALEAWIVEAEEILQAQDPSHSSDLSTIQERMEELKGQMLKFSSMVPDLDRLNELGYRLPLNDKEIKRMQNLNRHWSLISSQTTERFSKLQSFLLQHQTFLEKCETWMEFLVQTEQKLAVEISGNYQHLLEQQRAHELFQAEMFSRQQILHSIIIDGQRLLEQGQVDDRDEFNLKLTLLSNQWQGVIRRAQQRRGIIDSQIRQWQRYREMAEKLRKWLVEVSYVPATGLGSVPIPLQQARTLFDDAQFKEKVLLRQQGSYILTVEAGKQLLLSADGGAEAALQAELTEMQEKWRSASVHLEEQKKKLAFLLQDWEKCENGIADSLEKLRTFKKRLSQPLPDHHEELHAEQMHCKELETAVGSWTDDLAQLTLLKDTLCAYISADDISILNERMELLQRQWEELCHQLSLRRQQVSERLNEWAVFSEKNKELCEWLTQMESKVSQNGDILIEEMIEKLRKDYQEEIAIAQENKIQLQQMGERLARASHESKASEIEYKLGKINDRWQHLLDLMAA
ncbi:nesprin-1, partial [Camelus ferus]